MANTPIITQNVLYITSMLTFIEVGRQCEKMFLFVDC